MTTSRLSEILKNRIFLTAFAALVLFPAGLKLIITPSFSTIITTSAQSQAETIARHIARNVHLHDHLEAGHDTPPPGTDLVIRELMVDFDVLRVRFLDSEGTVTFSIPLTGQETEVVPAAALDELRRGEPLSRLTDAADASGETAGSQVLTLVPIMSRLEDDRFLGAFEILHDVTPIMGMLHRLTGWLDTTAIGVSLVLLLLAFAAVRREVLARADLREAYSAMEDTVAERTTRLRQANEELQLMAKVFEHSLDGISITDGGGRILRVNPAFSAITGYPPEEVVGQTPRILKSDRHDDDFYRRMWSSILNEGQWEGEIWNRRKNGEAYPEWLSISSVTDETDEPTHFVAVFHDISEIKRSEELMKHQAYHDALTGLPNRLLLLDRLKVAMHHSRRTGERLALLYLDVDNFKTINDSLGHSVGDLLLMSFAHRLKNLLREQDTVARLGGDEFVIMVEDAEGESSAVAVGERILDSLNAPFTVKGHELYVTTSVGITIFPEDGDTPDALIKNADLAMYRAKETGKNNCQLFTLAMNERAQQRLILEKDLRKAIEGRRFEVWYQPKVHLATGGIIGMEALVRWRREDGSLTQPLDFIPVAEETGMIVPIGEQVLEAACRQAKAWHDMGYGHLALAVNISVRQLAQKGLIGFIEGVMRRTDIDPSLLELEITETAIMSRVEQAVAVLEEIRRLGAHIAVDDFGTGYSSLYYLKRFPIRGLKVDRSFVSNLPSDADDLAIVRTVVSMARGLGLHVTAEGVENIAQMETLRSLDCDFCQGYLFSPPLSDRDFERLLETSGGILRPKTA